MSSQHKKIDGQSLSSLSLDPNQIVNGTSNIFGGRKSSFQYINLLKDSDQLPRRDFRNSLDILTSNINTTKNTNNNNAPLRQIIQVYNQENKIKIQQLGYKPLEIGQVYSQSQQQSNYNYNHSRIDSNNNNNNNNNNSQIKLQTVYNDLKFNYHSYFPYDLAEVLKQRQIPLEYVRGLLMVRDQKQIKSTRRLKVQRYLEKRRIKTWNRKICYNCRQKVAEERLRIKGKFIKKRRAMEILGITIPIETAILKQKLINVMKNKDAAQIQQLLKNTLKQKYGENQQSQPNQNQNQSGMDQQQQQEDQNQDQDKQQIKEKLDQNQNKNQNLNENENEMINQSDKNNQNAAEKK